MESIIDTSKAYDSFDFSKLQLIKPTLVSGGNYFIKCLVDEHPLYIQPPKCSTKQGIVKTGGGKRFYTDLMFTNENESFIHWMEKLENHCQQTIFKNREQWFDNELELDDIESYFTSPLKLYKSGKYYIARVNISTILGKPTIKIYDEDEREISFESITDKVDVMTILEIQGIKCSAKSFQFEMELKQMMSLKTQILFDKCLFKSKDNKGSNVSNDVSDKVIDVQSEKATEIQEVVKPQLEPEPEPQPQQELEPKKEPEPEPVQTNIGHSNLEQITEPETKKPPKSNELEEVVFTLDEIGDIEPVQIKQRNEVYYEMYREARKKAKIARDLALTAYLEAKNIKNTYMLTDLSSDSEEDDDLDDEEVIDLENDTIEKIAIEDI
uniref:Uncharacterized protein n=1 Tax=viral metagenome TaxID=1070528 RepID=A0A6C0ATM1_9ZZZZ